MKNPVNGSRGVGSDVQPVTVSETWLKGEGMKVNIQQLARSETTFKQYTGTCVFIIS